MSHLVVTSVVFITDQGFPPSEDVAEPYDVNVVDVVVVVRERLIDSV
jgi:hypothetical protein